MNHATFSRCGTYRYSLTRDLGSTQRPLVIVGLNPSTATAELDDQTIRKEVGFARLWGCGWIYKVNAYAYRATEPAALARARAAGTDVIGPGNARAIRRAIEIARAGILLVAWGGHIEPDRQRRLAGWFPDAQCLGTNRDGTPKHPLYVPYTTQRTSFIPSCVASKPSRA